MNGDSVANKGIMVWPPARFIRVWTRPVRIALVSLAAVTVIAFIAATVTYVRISRSLNARLADAGTYGATLLYSTPAVVAVGDAITPDEIVAELRASGYEDGAANAPGSYLVSRDVLWIKPRAGSAVRDVQIRYAGSKIATIVADNRAIGQYQFEPEMIAQVRNGTIERQRPVRYSEIPTTVVQALLSIED